MNEQKRKMEQTQRKTSTHLDSTEYKISVILLQVLEKLKEEPTASKLAAAKTIAGNDSLRTMQYVLPIVMRVEMQVLKYHGYDDTRESLIKFTQLIADLEKVDSAIRNLHDILKSHYLPPLPPNPNGNANTNTNTNHFVNTIAGSDSTMNRTIPSSH